jgi:hypothetical protein
MLKIIQRGVLALIFPAALLLPSVLKAQQPKDTGPIPAQIVAAKKVFISNGSGECGVFYCSTPQQPYNEFYTGMKNWGRYELVTAPSDADVVFEIATPSSPGALPDVRLVILDPKTRLVLWTLDEYVRQAARQATGRKNFSKAVSTLVQDVQKLTSAAQ